ncbi:MAG: hypothetical protein WDO56_11200 [Gammaproteobacteria bacterium]
MIYRDQISVERLYRAVDAVRAPDGSIACYSALVDPAHYGNCVPLNPMGAGSASPEALAYIHGEPWNYNIMEQDNAAASINGEPFSSWAGPVSVGAGVEWRKLQGPHELRSDFAEHHGLHECPRRACFAPHEGRRMGHDQPARDQRLVQREGRFRRSAGPTGERHVVGEVAGLQRGGPNHGLLAERHGGNVEGRSYLQADRRAAVARNPFA